MPKILPISFATLRCSVRRQLRSDSCSRTRSAFALMRNLRIASKWDPRAMFQLTTLSLGGWSDKGVGAPNEHISMQSIDIVINDQYRLGGHSAAYCVAGFSPSTNNSIFREKV